VTRCKATDCRIQVIRPKMFCEGHWDSLPDEIRYELADTYVVEAITPEWQQLLEDAVAYLEDQDGSYH